MFSNHRMTRSIAAVFALGTAMLVLSAGPAQADEPGKVLPNDTPFGSTKPGWYQLTEPGTVSITSGTALSDPAHDQRLSADTASDAYIVAGEAVPMDPNSDYVRFNIEQLEATINTTLVDGYVTTDNFAAPPEDQSGPWVRSTATLVGRQILVDPPNDAGCERRDSLNSMSLTMLGADQKRYSVTLAATFRDPTDQDETECKRMSQSTVTSSTPAPTSSSAPASTPAPTVTVYASDPGISDEGPMIPMGTYTPSFGEQVGRAAPWVVASLLIAGAIVLFRRYKLKTKLAGIITPPVASHDDEGNLLAGGATFTETGEVPPTRPSRDNRGIGKKILDLVIGKPDD